MSDITQRELAIQDCKYARSLGELALAEHIKHWTGFPPTFGSEEYEYWTALAEIKSKLDTDECLLGEKQ